MTGSGRPSTLRPYFRNCPLPPGEGGAPTPGEGSPLHDLQRLTEAWGGLPSSGAFSSCFALSGSRFAAPPSPKGRRLCFLKSAAGLFHVGVSREGLHAL